MRKVIGIGVLTLAVLNSVAKAEDNVGCSNAEVAACDTFCGTTEISHTCSKTLQQFCIDLPSGAVQCGHYRMTTTCTCTYLDPPGPTQSGGGSYPWQNTSITVMSDVEVFFGSNSGGDGSGGPPCPGCQ